MILTCVTVSVQYFIGFFFFFFLYASVISIDVRNVYADTKNKTNEYVTFAKTVSTRKNARFPVHVGLYSMRRRLLNEPGD